MPVNVFNNIPEPETKPMSSLDFLSKCLSNEFLVEMETKSLASELVKNIFGPIMLRARFSFKTDL